MGAGRLKAEKSRGEVERYECVDRRGEGEVVERCVSAALIPSVFFGVWHWGKRSWLVRELVARL